MQPLTVAILGNHSVSYCTESELDWTFEHLGHTVLRFQENESRTEEIVRECLEKKAELFIYIHTHGWQTPGIYSVEDMIKALRSAGIVTCGFHLDLYWGLNIADKRTDRIGKHPFWKMDYVFTADGGHQKEFAERGVNHYWLPPAVCERACHRGTYNLDYAVDVAFVGQRNYHPEYPFRAKLVDWLQSTYGDRFRRYAGDTEWGLFREERLNDMYASVKVCVGDSCFAGKSNLYWSDRIPETLGRGGFLLHPEVPGLDVMGLVTYKPQDFDDLKTKIDYYVENGQERKIQSNMGFGWVRANETYTNRVRKMLDVMGFA